MTETREALKCPECGYEGELVVECLEYVRYEYNDGEFVGPADGYENETVPGTPFSVICPMCSHAWEEDPWE